MMKLVKLSMVLFLAQMMIVSCSDLDDSNGDAGVVAEEFGSGGNCLELVYPLTVVLSDGTEITGESREEIRTAIREWKAANQGTRAKVQLAFPLEAINSDGETITVVSQEELRELKIACRGNNGGSRIRCFELVYPMTYVAEDGTEITGESKRELRFALIDYKKANPRAERPTLKFPIQVINSDGDTVEVADAEALQTLKDEC